jgi:hypothetical protein
MRQLSECPTFKALDSPSSRNSHYLLVEMQNGAIILEDPSLAVFLFFFPFIQAVFSESCM